MGHPSSGGPFHVGAPAREEQVPLRGEASPAISLRMILAFDTSGQYCAAALLRGEDVMCSVSEDMSRGQAERLIPLLEECLATAGAEWSGLNALAVGIGPGNFTGTRIAVSTARGLALALGIPAVGVSMFEVVALDQDAEASLVLLPAPRDRAYAQLLIRGEPASDPLLINPSEPPDDLPMGRAKTVVGHRASELARLLELDAIDVEPTNMPDRADRIARVAARRLSDGTVSVGRPAPLYVRPADAAPPSDPPPVILDP